MPRRRLTSCDQHTVRIASYLAFHEDADRRMARGEKQYKCAECGLYAWPYDAKEHVTDVKKGGTDA